MASASPLAPTFHGYIASTQDALLLFEACLAGAINHVARRPHDRERSSLIKSGNVFIYEEHSSGIKRWTDGVPWSPSRILGNFLVYRELERPFPPGEKKRAMKRSKRNPGINKPEAFMSQSSGMSNGYNTTSLFASNFDTQGSNPLNRETERSLIGSLIDSYGFKDEGLVKKTVSVTIAGVSHHLVSYYTVADVMNTRLTTPSKDPRFQYIVPRPDLITKQNFRTPIDEVDSVDRIEERTEDRPLYTNHPNARNGYEMTNQSIAHRPMPQSSPPLTYTSNGGMYNSYGQYDGFGQSQSQSTYDNQFVSPPGIYTSAKPEHGDASGYRTQRYNPAVGNVSDGTKMHMPPASASFVRRSSNYEQGSSAETELAGISSLSSEPKLITGSGYASHAFYSGMRDTATPHDYGPRRSLPTPNQPPSFDRITPQTYQNVGVAPSLKENMWVMGNSSAVNAQYMAPQHSWTSTGTS